MILCVVVMVSFPIWLSAVIYGYIFQYCHIGVILIIHTCDGIEILLPLRTQDQLHFRGLV
ncbi:hypothetical protein BDV38DRAFT_265415 [Aspergillus pseudotamarii]|uniref:Uncharacterized protein n=1 Tax=Aspergillus pseudotamarii TaxID=132259 RepID=A0A5N6S9B5_ASPPS|nr:uncharacterized protein BDV38DRAFT_265415 [Aspergillus pseudotamarii]KAE8131145.1 hypothetical protein BDV38DRAFT_265415 [Aspergillus pseudotamarii]